jgi:hypothetical protein
MIYPYSQEDKEVLEAPPVYQHDPRTKRQLVEMLRHNPYSDEDREYFMGEDSAADSFLRRAWSNMRRSLGAGPREPTRPFAKRNLFARLAPIPVFMITDWQGEPKFFEPENDYDPMVCVRECAVRFVAARSTCPNDVSFVLLLGFSLFTVLPDLLRPCRRGGADVRALHG